MPITKSAKKALRQSNKKRTYNLRRKKVMKDVLKEITKTDKKEEARKLLSKAYKAIDKAAKRGVIKKETAARKKSRLAKSIK